MKYEALLGEIPVRDVRGLVLENVLTVGPEQDIDVLLARMLEDPGAHHVYVVNEQGILVGSIGTEEVLARLFPFTTVLERDRESMYMSVPQVAADKLFEIMDPAPPTVQDSTPLAEVARILERDGISELPVVDRSMHLLGQINVHDIALTYLQRSRADHPGDDICD